MRIEIRSGLGGAEKSRGVVVIIDVFRAGNTAAALLAAGAPFIVPVAELDEALALKAQRPDWLLVGERRGIKPEGFEMNKSPAESAALDLTGRPAILTTSAGTRGLMAAAPGADVLIMATLVNISSAARFIRSLSPEVVTLVPMGLEGLSPAEEDEVAARHLAELLRGRQADYRAGVKAMLAGGGAARLRSLEQWRDLAYCLRLDALDIFPAASRVEGRLALTTGRA
ncbi:MAG: 2-phosphosulfolactate phosphatase [Pseudomonadota bacterium]